MTSLVLDFARRIACRLVVRQHTSPFDHLNRFVIPKHFPLSLAAFAFLCAHAHAAENNNPAAQQALTGLTGKLRHIPVELSKPAITDPTRLLIKTRTGLARSELDKIIKPHKGRLLKRLAALDLNVIELPAGQASVANILKRHPHIRFAEPDRKVRIAANDPYAVQQWHLAKVSAPQAWDIATGEGIVVAVLDTGVYANHQDLAGKLVSGWNTYDNNSDTADVHGHGTLVSGVIAAITNNNIGVASIAWGAKIMPIRITDLNGYAYYSDIVEGIVWAADHGARVANVSFSGVAGSPAIHNAAEYMNSKGGIVVVAAGNGSGFDPTEQSFPVIAVSATDSNDNLTGWSSYGNYVDIAAPGQGIYTTDRTAPDSYASVSGTSFSSPLAAAVVALMLSENSALQPAQLTSLLLSSATDMGAAGYDMYYGHGRVNAYAAVQAARDTLARDTEAPTVSIISPITGIVAALVPIDVAANDNVGVTRVELFVNGLLIGTDTGAPYAFSWNSTVIPDGNASLQAYAYDAAGNFTASQNVTLTVKNTKPNAAPLIALTAPLNNAVFSAPAAITINADASDSDGSIAKVEFFQGTTKLGEATSAPYKLIWNNVVAGTYSLTATARDNLNAVTASNPISVTVTQTSSTVTTQLQQGLNGYAGTKDAFCYDFHHALNFGALSGLKVGNGNRSLIKFAIFASEGGPIPDGATIAAAELSIYKAEADYEDLIQARRLLKDWSELETTWDSASNNTAWSLGGASSMNNDIASIADGEARTQWHPHWLTIDVTAGVRSFANGSPNYGWRLGKANAVEITTLFYSRDYSGNQYRPKLTITYTTASSSNIAPTISISSPVDGTSYVAPASITINANAGDSDGSIAKVEFFQGTTKLGEATSAPYSFNWTNVPSGSYSLTARAVDNLGAATTSSITAITVNAASNKPPVINIASPTQGASYVAPATVQINVNASDSDGSIAKVEFFQGTIKLGEATSAPYSFTWRDVAAGTYNLTATARDNLNAVMTSNPVTVTVTNGSSTVTTQLQDGLNGYAGTRDAFSYDFHHALNFGSLLVLKVGISDRSLIKFAIFASEGGPIPDGATITSAELAVYKAEADYEDLIQARRLLKDWNELETTWDRASNNTAWSLGGASSMNNDIAPIADGEARTQWHPHWLAIDVTAGVQSFANGSPNYGWHLGKVNAAEVTTGFYSREYGNPQLRPKLTITYSTTINTNGGQQ